jgi:hypothetical protein
MQQETLEEATILAWDLYEHTEGHLYSTTFKNAFKLGANWKAERTYSEEDMQEYAEFCIICYQKGLPCIIAQDWFRLYKKK